MIKIENNFLYLIKMMRSNNAVTVRKHSFEKDFTCKAYEIESPTIPPWIEPLAKTAKMAAAKTTKFPRSSNLKPNHLQIFIQITVLL